MNTGPGIAARDMPALEAWLRQQCIQYREHQSLRGIQIKHGGNWLSLIWNRLQGRYTADSRLAVVINSFRSST